MTVAVGRRPLAVAAVVAAALSWAVALPSAGTPSTPARTVGVIVQGAHSAESTVRELGGRITHDLPLIGGFSARVPAADVPRIAQLPGVASVSPDATTHVQSVNSSPNTLPSVYKKATRGDALNSAGARGQGVTVALIDTGVSPLSDVSKALVRVAADPLGLLTSPCMNFTDEPSCNDTFGHGTFMAGIIAGDGSASNGKYAGMAPAAKVLSVKIAGASGAADVSTVIAAIQWVVDHRSAYNIRVLNLSLGTDSTQSYTIDPLDYAVERAWSSGIVVNVAASNRGPAASTISDPANDPFVITVGAVDDRGTSGVGDDTLPDFSGRGPTATDHLFKPDVVAPGAHIVSLAAPGATITQEFPSSMAAPYRRGSGTSMANAVVSGLVADLLSAHPSLSPDRVKYMLTSSARNAASTDPLAVGSGEVDGWAAQNAGAGLANVGVTPSTGVGSLAASRGTVSVVLDDTNQTVLDASSGDLTGTLTDLDTMGSNWFGSNWFGSNWFGSNWFGSNWFGSNWFGEEDPTSSYGSNWFGSAWYGAWDQ